MYLLRLLERTGMKTLISILTLSIVAFASNSPVILSVSINYSTNQITATGTNFSTSPTVTFGGTAVSVLSSTTTQITATLPTGLVAGTYKLSITTNPGLIGEIAVEYGSITPALTFSTLCSLIPRALASTGNNINLASVGCDKIVFVSSQVYTGNFGGPSGANASCQELANEGGLPGQYKAWLDGSGDFDEASVPYIQIDNRNSGTSLPVIANSYAELISSSLIISINETEQRLDVTDNAWTGIDLSLGAPYPTGHNCNNWTSDSSSIDGTVGRTSSIDGTWTNYIPRPCNLTQRLYCFQQ